MTLVMKNISKYYIKNGERLEILNNVNFQFNTRNFYSIIGPSGIGKTTLLNCLGTIDTPSKGKIIINNKEISKISEYELDNIRRDNIGFIFQNYYLSSYMTVLENVCLPMYLKIKNKEKIMSRALELLKMVGLENRAKHFPSELSGGEQQRVCIARALANSPSIILADEPTGNLDKTNSKIILNILKKLSKDDCCVIMVTHDEEAIKYSDKVLEIKNGKLVEK